MRSRGYFGIGIENAKIEHNVGTLWRSAYAMGASFIFTVGRRMRQQSSDTTRAWRHIPYYRYDTLDDLYATLPCDAQLVGVEFPHDGARELSRFTHPDRCVYLLGAEDTGLSQRAINRCHHIVYIEGDVCLNVAAAGSVIMYDRKAKRPKKVGGAL